MNILMMIAKMNIKKKWILLIYFQFLCVYFKHFKLSKQRCIEIKCISHLKYLIILKNILLEYHLKKNNMILLLKKGYKNSKGEPWNYIQKLWYYNGQLASEYNYKEGLEHGIQKKWYFNGQLAIEHNYKKGLEHGVSKGWWYNGKLEYERYYKEGKLHGNYKVWYVNGQLNFECNYKDGNLSK